MINRVVLVGRLTKDVEVRKTQNGLSVAQFTVACDRRKSSEGESSADFINCVAWRQSADFLGQYARKGAMVGVEGRIQTRNYDNAQGQRVYVTEVVADSVSLCESKKSQESSNESPKSAGTSFRASDAYTDDSRDEYAESLGIDPDDLPF